MTLAAQFIITDWREEDRGVLGRQAFSELQYSQYDNRWKHGLWL